jgi:hypothetical protein
MAEMDPGTVSGEHYLFVLPASVAKLELVKMGILGSHGMITYRGLTWKSQSSTLPLVACKRLPNTWNLSSDFAPTQEGRCFDCCNAVVFSEETLFRGKSRKDLRWQLV